MSLFRSVEIKKSSIDCLEGDSGELRKADIEGPVKGLTPGEWVLVKDPSRRRVYLGFANPLVQEKQAVVHVVKRLKAAPDEKTVQSYLEEQLKKAVERRSRFEGYEHGARVIYGDADGLPGLIVDSYKECALIQINTAGMEKWREFLREKLSELLKLPCYFLDNPAQRSKEILPHHHGDLPFEKMAVVEDGLNYVVPTSVLQKVGWYYDHRENRKKFEQALGRWKGHKETGADLFCYGGAWGMHALRGGVKNLTFVDQGNLGEMVLENLKQNQFGGRGEYARADVFDWLNGAIKEEKKFDVLISDPPAFAKSPKDKSAALEGYRKLHKKVLMVCSSKALVAFASCTHYVDLTEFMQTIAESARSSDRKVQILELGMQGWDHPVDKQDSHANYIKYVLVAVE